MRALISCLTVLVLAPAAVAQWVEYENQTATRLVAAPSIGVSDNDEKDFALGDIDKDGDQDLVVVRKQPLSVSGPRRNVLFMNEGTAEGHPINGVFVDRTNDYALAATDGGQGFLDLTNDRDVILVDVDGDDWLDIVTAVSVSDGLPKTRSHPRIYRNLGNDVNGDWQGFIYEEFRIPQVFTIGTNIAVAPRFCSVAAGDVDQMNGPDLYFGDYDNGETAPPMPPGHDANDRLFMNDGTGNYTDSLEIRMNSTMLLSAFGMAVAIEDMNGDGVLDIVKDTALQTPQRVSISYNNPGNPGMFNNFDVIYSASPYHITTGDLNNDGLIDIVVTDDGTDRYMLNQGNGGDGMANFTTLTVSTPTGFGGNSWIADLNNDSFNDVIITDFDVDSAQSGQITHVYRNMGNLPNISLVEEQVGTPWSPEDTHDVVTLDLNGDGWLDIVYGTSTVAGQQGYQIWMNLPPIGLDFAYPNGLPEFVSPSGATVTMQVEPFGGAEPAEDTGVLHLSINNGPYQEIPMTHLGNDEYEADIPGGTCLDTYSFYFSAEMEGGGTFTDPSSAPASVYSAILAEGADQLFLDEIEADVSNWSIVSQSLVSGEWEQADPNGTLSGSDLASPENDATPAGTMAFVTENGPPGGGAGNNDVDGGPTRLISPSFDLAAADGRVTFAAWMFDSLNQDTLDVDVSNNGGANWVPVMEISPTDSSWQNFSFIVGQYVTPTADVRIRFSVADAFTASIVEAGIDNFEVENFVCLTCDGDGDCDDGNACTADTCEGTSCIFSDTTPSGECCNPTNGVLSAIDDGNACTIDACQSNGNVTHAPNYNQSTQCCNPDSGVVQSIDDGDDCTQDVCDTETGVVQRVVGIPDAQGVGSRRISVVPQTCTSDVALLVTSDDHPCVSFYVGETGTPSVTPFYQKPSNWNVVPIRSLEIVPESTYRVQTETLGGDVSDVDEATTLKWADTTENGAVNLDDALAIVLLIEGSPSNATPEAADLDPCMPNAAINLADALVVVVAIEGQVFENLCPIPCP